MATTYEQSSTTTSSEGIGLDKDYIKTYNGLLKIVECVLDIIAFICASIYIHWGPYGGGWVQFVTMSAFITTLLLFGFHLFRIIYKLPGPWGLIELIYYVLYSLMMLIAGIVCAARGNWDASIGAAAFFTFAATACYVFDTFLLFRGWQQGRSGGGSSHTTTTTTTEHTTYETKTQY
ncbi:CKLF-like MARVEL transmembrane domain-containing protein 4 isoform X1 [Ruditapes philippinarum]|uniref:CKLF-like MARVEL transmembrane domain-containing protein 4 isoform X1 n=1 Tax=Ruditapes philippinarum TaxID=129788 RepID=UPI00295B202E|nr:CKLF-like MARVEL transmembrane domain-containing protein 4 isoform X1 [Ruditapes philippinarum]XP_060565398.1 CKLF-like MARVEL transmembrane domain-containing protein 4 isoform X1 [Ruditapes philippinarum]